MLLYSGFLTGFDFLNCLKEFHSMMVVDRAIFSVRYQTLSKNPTFKRPFL